MDIIVVDFSKKFKLFLGKSSGRHFSNPHDPTPLPPRFPTFLRPRPPAPGSHPDADSFCDPHPVPTPSGFQNGSGNWVSIGMGSTTRQVYYCHSTNKFSEILIEFQFVDLSNFLLTGHRASIKLQ